MSTPHVRVRFAPSPTGYFHIGGLRTALYCFLLARSAGGSFILRIEDTDRGRFVADAEQDILDCLEWTGLCPNEGPVQGGPHAPYRQSERSHLYRSYADQLIAQGNAYYAFDTPGELTAIRTSEGPAAAYTGATMRTMRNALTLTQSEVDDLLDQNTPHVIRLRTPDSGDIQFRDEIRTNVVVPAQSIDDQILIKSDGMPTYHLANVVDDHLMEVTHVVRGEEWLPSTPKHILLYKALGWEPPTMAHLPLILSPAGGKLSKRHATKLGIPVLVREYREAGYEPEALINYLAMLGWNPGSDRELYTLQELAGCFSLDRVGSSAAQFSINKLDWFNTNHLRRFSKARIQTQLQPGLTELGVQVNEDYVKAAVNLVMDRIQRVSDILTEYLYLFRAPTVYDETGVRKRWKSDAPILVAAYAERIGKLTSFTDGAVEEVLRALAKEKGVGAGRIIHPVRLAVSGTFKGPSLFSLLVLLGHEECIRRMQRAISALPVPCD